MRRALLTLFGALLAHSLNYGDQQLFILEMDDGEIDSARRIADEHGFRLIRPLHSFPNIFVAEHLPQRRKRSLDDIIAEIVHHRKINWAEPVSSFVREKRWFLSRADPTPSPSPILPRNLTGKGVVVAILDDGVDYSHPALYQTFHPEHSFDFVTDSPDPFPDASPDSNHGTHCAGVVSMSPSSCGTGVAPGASLSALKMLGSTESINDIVEGDALAFHHKEIGIYSVSWGPRDDGRSAEAPRKLANIALEKGATEGRDGKGSLYIWASGNGGLEGDDCAMDGYASHKRTLTFGVVGATGKPEWYAEGCPAVIAAVPAAAASRWTTEVGGGCARFSGSSAAAPYAAGVLALLLEANPSLTQRDVQHILVKSSQSKDLVTANPSEWTKNGAGLHVSRYFGFGILDAENLVEMARDWKNVPAEKSCQQEISPSTGKFSSTQQLQLSVSLECNEVSSIERVELEISLTTSRRGDLHIQLVSPSGTVTDLLKPRRNDDSSDGLTNWRFVSMHTWGENPKGKWTIHIRDTGSNRQEGELTKATLFIHGT